MRFKRIFLIVLDSVGIGALPDAEKFGDAGANTLGHIAESQGGLNVPHLEWLGLGSIAPLNGVRAGRPAGSYGKMQEVSLGKDTTSGHWEIAGCPMLQSVPYFPNGFPLEMMERFMDRTGCTGYLGNRPASGTQIIAELGSEHLATGKPIVYTSADSVFQIAAHESVIPLQRLYEICEITRREVAVDDWAVNRVIARPFIGEPGSFVRTPERHDYSLQPPAPTVLDALKAAGQKVIGVGKINDIFAGQGITDVYRTKSNSDGMIKTIELAEQLDWTGLAFINLVEFDSLYGHRNNPAGYKKALETFDEELGGLIARMQEDDLLIITADHGCDPTMLESTDHSREYVPVLMYSLNSRPQPLGIRKTFADVAATIADNFELSAESYGRSFFK